MFAFLVAATRERTCAYGSFSLARAVAAPRVPCAGGLTAPLPNEAEAPHGFCAGATDVRGSASDRRAIATVDVAPSRDARASSRAPPRHRFLPPSRKPRNAFFVVRGKRSFFHPVCHSLFRGIEKVEVAQKSKNASLVDIVARKTRVTSSASGGRRSGPRRATR